MTRWRKAALWTGSVAVAAAIAGAFAVHAIADPERLRNLVRDKARAAWARELVVGDVSLELWPLPAVRATGVALDNPPWARERHLFEAARLTARFALWPLFAGRVRIGSLALDGVTADLEVAKDGARNWDLRRRDAPLPAHGTVPREDLFDLTDVRIANATIRHRGATGAEHTWHVDQANVTMRAGLRDVRIDASVARDGRALKLKGVLADLSRLGERGAAAQGDVNLDWEGAVLRVAGALPLDGSLRSQGVHVDFKAPQWGSVVAFFGGTRNPPGALAASFDARGADGATDITNLVVTLGPHRVTGEARVSIEGRKPEIALRVKSDRLDWARVLRDAGGPPPTPLAPLELFQDRALAWGALEALRGTRGMLEASVASLRLPNGIEVRGFTLQSAFDDDHLEVKRFAGEMLGGSASGSMDLVGGKRQVKLRFTGNNLLLERWFRERGSRIAFTGGPMRVTTSLSAHGKSMKDLAASATGPFELRMGRGALAAPKAGQIETVMTETFAGREDAREIDFQCVGAALRFESGRAHGKDLVGAVSDISRLLTSGTIDLRDATLDLAGRIKPREGGGKGLSALVGDVRIEGKIRKPTMTLDKPKAVARVGAALATLGASVLGTAVADAATREDPCAEVFAKQ